MDNDTVKDEQIKLNILASTQEKQLNPAIFPAQQSLYT